MNRALVLLAVLVACAPGIRADAPALLKTAMGAWTSGEEDWSFTRRTLTFDSKGNVRDDRVESYDPSRPENERWRLLEVNGQPPSESDLKAENKKNRRPRRYGSDSTGQMLDLDNASIKEQTPASVTYLVPLKQEPSALIETRKLIIYVKVDRRTQEIERLTAQLSGPMRIALGLAHITDVDLDLSLDPAEEQADPAKAPATGTARAKLSTFGERREYQWSDFKAVHVDRDGH